MPILIGNLLTTIGLNTNTKVGGTIQFFIYDVIKIMVLLGVLIFLISYAVSFALSLISYTKLNVRLFDEKLIASSGLIVRHCTYIEKNAVNAILTEQSPIMRFFGRYCIRVSAAGYGKKRKSRVLIPSISNAECESFFDSVFGGYKPKTPFIRPKKQKLTLWRFYFMPTVYGIIIISMYATATLFFSSFARVVLFLSAVLMAVNLYYTYLCRLDYKNSKISFGDIFCAESSHILSLRRLNCEKEKIGEIRIIRTPADRLYRTCKVKIALRSQDAENIRVRHINYDAAIKKICKNYGIKL